jgi:hypothetical protein
MEVSSVSRLFARDQAASELPSPLAAAGHYWQTTPQWPRIFHITVVRWKLKKHVASPVLVLDDSSGKSRSATHLVDPPGRTASEKAIPGCPAAGIDCKLSLAPKVLTTSPTKARPWALQICRAVALLMRVLQVGPSTFITLTPA